MKRKLLVIGAMVAIAVTGTAVAMAAVSHVSGSKVEADTTTLYWSGQGSDANFGECGANADFGAGGVQNGAGPNNYMLWIFATDGGSVSAPPTLTINGTTYGNAYKPAGQDSDFGFPGAWQIVTPFVSSITPANRHDQSSTGGAYTSFTVNDTGSGDWQLTISHGCSGGQRTPAAGPSVTKDANGSYDNTFTWNIDKSVDQPQVFTAGGASATVNYEVTVSHDAGTPSNVKVTGTIDVNNPDTGSEKLDSITDNIVDGSNAVVASCDVDTSAGLVVSVGDTLYPYSCDLGSSPPSGDVFNNVTIAWSDQDVGATQHLAAGSADFTTPSPINFTANPIDDCITVNDTNPAGPQNQQVCVGDANPTEFDYSADVNGDAGTCTPNDNTASFTTNDTGATGSAGATVNDCQGADLKVSKTAAGTYDRECSWTIDKSVVGSDSKTGDAGQPTSFSYEVTLGATCNTVKNVKVTGTITVSNPNDWEDITLTDLSDALDASGGANCTIDTSPGLTIPRASGGVDGSVTYNYTCSPASLNDTLNTATATWDADTYHTPTGTASGNADVSFTQTLIDDCVDVSDNYKGSLGHFCTDAAGNITGSNGAVNPIDYNLSFTGPAAGTCQDFTNKASAADNSTPQVTVNDTATVHLCSFGPRFTPGYWKNHLAPNGTSGCKSLPNGTSCGSNGPFASAWTNSTQWKCLGGLDNCSGVVTVAGYTGFKVDTILKAAQIFSAMSCSFSGNAANQNQQAIGCLAGKLLAAKYNININHSNTCIAPVITLADNFLSPGHSVTYGGYTAQSITYTGPSGTYTGITSTGTSNNQRQVAIALQNALDAYDNGGGCH